MIFDDASRVIQLIVYPIVAVILAKPLVYIGGFLLTRYYNTYRTFVKRLSLTKDDDHSLHDIEKWEKDSY